MHYGYIHIYINEKCTNFLIYYGFNFIPVSARLYKGKNS